MRIAILGNSGSGKSSLARAIAIAVNCQVLDLDTIAWHPGVEAMLRPAEDVKADVRAFCCGQDRWIVEGCYADLIAVALESKPKLLFLNPGMQACLENCQSRPWEPHKYASIEEQNARLPALLSWVSEYYTRTGDLSLRAHVDCFSVYPGKKRELKSVPSLAPLDPELLCWLH